MPRDWDRPRYIQSFEKAARDEAAIWISSRYRKFVNFFVEG
jgi:hypothetical protein